MKRSKFLIPVAIAIFSVCVLNSCVQSTETSDTNGVWSIEKANAWQEETGWLSGCNFQPSTAINALEMWQEETFDPATLDRELGWAEDLGFNVMRVWLNSLAYQADPEGFKERVDQYLEISDSHGISTMVVFFLPRLHNRFSHHRQNRQSICTAFSFSCKE